MDATRSMTTGPTSQRETSDVLQKVGTVAETPHNTGSSTIYAFSPEYPADLFEVTYPVERSFAENPDTADSGRSILWQSSNELTLYLSLIGF